MNTGDIAQLDKDIARVENELSALLKRRVNLLEAELKAAQQQALAHSAGGVSVPASRGTRSAAPKAAPTTVKSKPAAKKRGKRTRMSSEDVTNRTVETVKSAGADGLSQKEISDKSGVHYQTTAKKLKELLEEGVVGKRGKLKSTRYFFKG
tara:strand:- start:6727 stop:7179 length:453 start_codon:yes stop_codon:yes gene_type:complete